jgi:RNA polymerase sigma-70 factor (ECF subfamily)
MLRTFRRLDRFEPRLEHALRAYLRQAVQNRILDELRRTRRQPNQQLLDSSHPDDRPSPLDHAQDEEERRRYGLALARLNEDERQLIVARVDLGYSYEQIALLTGRATANAARVAIRRALQKLGAEMERVDAPHTDR